MHDHLPSSVNTQTFHGFVHAWNDFPLINGRVKISICKSFTIGKSTNVVPSDHITTLYLHTAIFYFVRVYEVQHVIHKQTSSLLFCSLNDDYLNPVHDIRASRDSLIETFFSISKLSRDGQDSFIANA